MATIELKISLKKGMRDLESVLSELVKDKVKMVVNCNKYDVKVS